MFDMNFLKSSVVPVHIMKISSMNLPSMDEFWFVVFLIYP